MNIAKISLTFAIALVLVLTATGLWAAGRRRGAGSRRRQEVCNRPRHRQGGVRARVRRDNNLRQSRRAAES